MQIYFRLTFMLCRSRTKNNEPTYAKLLQLKDVQKMADNHVKAHIDALSCAKSNIEPYAEKLSYPAVKA